jgi:hypothetical protein
MGILWGRMSIALRKANQPQQYTDLRTKKSLF